MCPKISRRSAPGFHQKQSTRPQIFRRYAPEPCKWCQKCPNFSGSTRRETHHQISPHILNMSLQPCFPAWPVRSEAVKRSRRSSRRALAQRPKHHCRCEMIFCSGHTAPREREQAGARATCYPTLPPRSRSPDRLESSESRTRRLSLRRWQGDTSDRDARGPVERGC